MGLEVQEMEKRAITRYVGSLSQMISPIIEDQFADFRLRRSPEELQQLRAASADFIVRVTRLHVIEPLFGLPADRTLSSLFCFMALHIVVEQAMETKYGTHQDSNCQSILITYRLIDLISLQVIEKAYEEGLNSVVC